MRDHHSYPVEFIGASDSAVLPLVGFNDGEKPAIAGGVLYFGEDGAYTAHVVDGDAIIPAHYWLVFEANKLLAIYDDEGRSATYTGHIKVFRAGERGCIIQILGD